MSITDVPKPRVIVFFTETYFDAVAHVIQTYSDGIIYVSNNTSWYTIVVEWSGEFDFLSRLVFSNREIIVIYDH